MRELSIRVSGLTCASCAAGLNQYLLKKSGIRSVNTNYADATLQIEYDESVLTELTQLERYIHAAGFRVPIETVLLQCGELTDESLAHCRKALSCVFGVKSVGRDKNGQSLCVQTWPIHLNTIELTNALRRAGISASVLCVEGGEEEQEQFWQIQMLRRLCAAVLLTMPLMWNPSPLVQFALATLVQFGPGRYFFRGAAQAVRSRMPNMDFLITVSTSLIYAYSAYLAWTVKSDIQLYFLAQCVLLSLLLFGKYLEILAKGATARSIRGLLRLQPEEAIVEREGLERAVPISEITELDIVLLRAGERIPVDGNLIEGECIVDESMLTGESMPIHKKIGDAVKAGTLNRSGSARLAATSVGKDTVLQQIIQAVRRAQLSKAPVQDFADRIAAGFIPVVLAIAAAVFCVWYFVLTGHDLERALLTACGVLVVACPCALGLATPTSIMVGTGRASELGILFRAASDLEMARKVDTVVFDKTGTLTYGVPTVTDSIFPGIKNRESLFQMIAALERCSAHPIAGAVAQYCCADLPQKISVQEFIEAIGYGVSGQVLGHRLCCGSRAFLQEQQIDLSGFGVYQGGKAGNTEIYVAVDDCFSGVFLLADQVRDSAASVVRELIERGIEVWMLSGDQTAAAEAVAAQTGIEHILSEVKPEEKAVQIERLRAQGKTVAMIGDGINDAPALVFADVAIAMGTGTDIAMESSGILLLGGRIDAVPEVFALSAQVMRNVRQNLMWALAYNGVCIPLAACGVINPSIAAAAMSASSIAVLLHALRLRKFTPKHQIPHKRKEGSWKANRRSIRCKE